MRKDPFPKVAVADMGRTTRILAVVAILVGGAPGQSLIEQIGWQGADWRVGIALIVIALSSVGLLSVVYFRGRRNQERDARRADERAFSQTAERLGLSPAEVAVARRLLHHAPPVQPQVIFQSITVFEKCVDTEIAGLLASKVDTETLTEADTLISGLRQKTGFMHIPLEHPLVSTRNISIGQTGSLFGRNNRVPLIQRASVTSMSERTLTLQYKVDQEELVQIGAGSEVRFAFARSNDGLYGVVLRVARSDGAGQIEVYHTLDIRRNQLRQYVRIEASLPLKFRLLRTQEPEKSEIRQGESVEARMSDISGGGLSFLCERMLKPGDLTSLSFSLPNARFSGIACKILRISLQEGKTATHYKHHAQFTNLEARKRDAVVRYVFDKQRQASQWR